MKRFLTVVFALTMLSRPASAGDLKREFHASKGKRLTMNIESGGAIIITGWEKELVTVDVDRHGADDKECRVDFRETPAGVSIESAYEGRRHNYSTGMTFTLNVPRNFDLELETTGGAITIDGVEGKINGTTMGGALDLTRLKGILNLHTMGGKITLTKSEVDGEVQTNGGKVLLEDVVGNVKGHSMGGAVTYRNVTDRKGSSTGSQVVISSMGGELNVDDAPYGADVQTMGGDIDIRSAVKFVKAKTMGGDIHIGSIDGSVLAETMGGDVEVTMVGDPASGNRDVNISSKGGDIDLTVPAALSMEVDISIAKTREWRGRGGKREIVSDFPLKLTESPEWESRHGSPRKYLTGSGTVAGGKNRIRIETINGSVHLKKGS
jgi:DUF4097 and DUF4098 domain-containing protein YvlB